MEDEPLWQEGIRAILATDPRFKLVDIAEDYPSALDAFQSHKPQVILLDWKIKGDQDGLAVGETILQQGVPPERIILISSSQASSIPGHPFLHIPKTRLSEELLPLLISVTIH